jgi:hypothetical protein
MIELTLDNPASNKFVEHIGKFIINFGVIEMTIIELCDALSQDPVLTRLAHRALLSRRIDILKEQIKAATLPIETEETLLNHLKELRPFIELRNILAHNPLIFAFPNSDPTLSPLVSGIMNMRPKDKTKDGEIVGSDELLGGVNNTSRLARLLLGELETIRDLQK